MNLQIIKNSLLKNNIEPDLYSVIELESGEIMRNDLTKIQAEDYVLERTIQRASPEHFEAMLSMCFNGMAPDINTRGDYIQIVGEVGSSIPGNPLSVCFKLLKMKGYQLWNIESKDFGFIIQYKKETSK